MNAQWYALIGSNAHTIALEHGDDVWAQTYWSQGAGSLGCYEGVGSVEKLWRGRLDRVVKIPENEVREWTQWREEYDNL